MSLWCFWLAGLLLTDVSCCGITVLQKITLLSSAKPTIDLNWVHPGKDIVSKSRQNQGISGETSESSWQTIKQADVFLHFALPGHLVILAVHKEGDEIWSEISKWPRFFGPRFTLHKRSTSTAKPWTPAMCLNISVIRKRKTFSSITLTQRIPPPCSSHGMESVSERKFVSQTGAIRLCSSGQSAYCLVSALPALLLLPFLVLLPLNCFRLLNNFLY